MPIKHFRKLIGYALAEEAAPGSLQLDGREVPVRYRRNPRAQRIVMRMDKTGKGIVLTVPDGTSHARAHEFARSQSGWIWQRLEAASDQKDSGGLAGASIIVRGTSHVIIAAEGRGVPVHIRDLPEPSLMVRGEPEHMVRRITDFLKREAKADLERTSRAYADAMNVSFKTITVRDTTSRWGSCSSNGTLSYSWRLILAPPRVLDYVAAHEVAHLREMNHGPGFWELVYRHCPHTDMARKWLRKNGHTLHRLPI